MYIKMSSIKDGYGFLSYDNDYGNIPYSLDSHNKLPQIIIERYSLLLVSTNLYNNHIHLVIRLNRHSYYMLIV